MKNFDNLVGITFANNWEITESYTCAEYREIYIKMTGDTSKKIKNTHYLVKNNECGISTYMERSTIKRNIDGNIPVLSKCKGCKNGSKLKDSTCYYNEQCRVKNLNKIPDRAQRIEVGKIYGNFLVKEIGPSANYPDHQCRAIVECIHCGAIQEARFNSLIDCSLACECFKNHSSGEMIVKHYLDEHNIPYITEQVFGDLVGIGSGSLRYDFAIYKNGEIIRLIEVDGDQHFKTGTLYNPDGKVQIHDQIKNEYAEKLHIPLTRLTYKDLPNINEILNNLLQS